jgi:hypothetical protein
MTRRVWFSAAVALCSLLICLSAGEPAALAASSPGPTPHVSTSYRSTNSPFSLTVSPTRLTVTAADVDAPHEILVVNRGKSALNVSVQERNFTANKDGSLQFGPEAPYSASTWLTVQPASFVLAPGASRTVRASITIPSRPEPGDHAVALVFLVPAGQSAANIKINRGVATPVFITVAGPTSDSATLTRFHGPGFATGGPIGLSATVNDTGTVHRDFRGATALLVTGAGQRRTVFPDFTVMRGATRIVNTTWHPPIMCICNPKVTVLNADGAVQTRTLRVIVFPIVQFAIVLGALLLLALILLLGRRRYRTSVARAAVTLDRSVSREDG